MATNGINRIISPLANTFISTDQALKNLIRWDTRKYANIWVVNKIENGTIAGYANYPVWHGSNFDGVVVINDAMKNITGYGHTTLVHEIGHYLGLYHTFEGGCTNRDCKSDGDRVCDTPPDATTVGPGDCSAIINSCSTDAESGFPSDQNDINWNYLDYGNRPCRAGFTEGQSARMRLFLQSSRNSLLESVVCLSPCNIDHTAIFTTSKDSFNIGEEVFFTNLSQNATRFTWFINGVEVSQERDFSIILQSPMRYRITLMSGTEDGLCKAVFGKDIIIHCPVNVDFSINKTNFITGETLTARHNGNGKEIYQWYLNNTISGSENL